MSTDSYAAGSLDLGVPQARLVSMLRTIDYPAVQDDLLRIAVSDHLDVVTIAAIRELPLRDYHGAADVLKAMGAPQVDAEAPRRPSSH